jgi:hypothetical protein
VAENGVNATVCTFEIAGGGPLGALGEVVVVEVAPSGVPGGGTGLASLGYAMNVRSRA